MRNLNYQIPIYQYTNPHRKHARFTRRRLRQRRRGLFDAQHLAVIIDHHLETGHAEIRPHVFRNADLKKLFELLVDILELVLDDRLAKRVLRADHLGRLLAEQVLVPLDQAFDLVQDLPVHLLRGDMAQKPAVVDHVIGLGAHIDGLHGAIEFIENQTSKKSLSGHIRKPSFQIEIISCNPPP